MTSSIWETIAETPWWFYLFVIGFIQLGLSATKPRIVPIKQIFALPLLYLSLSFVCIYLGIQSTLINWSYWLGACVAGGLLGWLQMLARRVKAVKNDTKLYLPGSWVFFLLVLAMIFIKYYLAYQFTNITFDTLSDPNYAKLFMGIFGLCAGLYLGRIIYALRAIKAGPFIQI